MARPVASLVQAQHEADDRINAESALTTKLYVAEAGMREALQWLAGLETRMQVERMIMRLRHCGYR